MNDSSVQLFADNLARLLELERQAEVEQSSKLLVDLSPSELEARGIAILGLEILEEGYSVGGRTRLVLAKIQADDLPAHRLRAGDRIRLSALTRSKGVNQETQTTAIVRHVGRRSIRVVLDQEPESALRPPLRVDRVADDVTYRRLRTALETLANDQRGPARRIIEVAFAQRDPALNKSNAPFDSKPDATKLYNTLDTSQQKAVQLALKAQDVALIHGPPGTGKTTTVAAAIELFVERGDRVIACAPSNVAVDNLLERLPSQSLKLVRCGHPARLLPSVVEHSLETQIAATEGSSITAAIRKEIDTTSRRLRRAGDRTERQTLRDERRRLFRELRELEQRTIQEILDSASVVLCTCTGAGDPLLRDAEFDVAVIDEAAQATEPACWIPLFRARKALLAGDHCQLPPTVLSREAARNGLATTLFERLQKRHADVISCMLTVQYRMHESIMRWSSDALYDGKLQAHPSVSGHRLQDLADVENTPDTSRPLLFIDTAGCDLEEEEEGRGDSRANPGEARVVRKHLESLSNAGIAEEQIAVITPYNAQVELLRDEISDRWPDVEIGSVDGFQGREKEAVIISLVRSNPRRRVGFLSDDRRLNVAVTRARRHVAIVGDSTTVTSHKFIEGLLDHCQKHGEYRSAWEYL